MNPLQKMFGKIATAKINFSTPVAGLRSAPYSSRRVTTPRDKTLAPGHSFGVLHHCRGNRIWPLPIFALLKWSRNMRSIVKYC